MAHRNMNVGIGLQFLLWEYLFHIFGIVSMQCVRSNFSSISTSIGHDPILIVLSGRFNERTSVQCTYTASNGLRCAATLRCICEFCNVCVTERCFHNSTKIHHIMIFFNDSSMINDESKLKHLMFFTNFFKYYKFSHERKAYLYVLNPQTD
jgi:hypothetical protein